MKKTLKSAVLVVFSILALPLVIIYYFSKYAGMSGRVFQGTSQFLSLFPGLFGVYLRASYYRWVCNQTSSRASIGFLTTLSHADTSIADGVYIGSHGNIGMCSIGRDCLLGSGVHLLSGKNQHNFSNPAIPIKNQAGSYTKISIGEDSWVGNKAIIMANVGTRCVVAAGAVVTKDVPDFCIVAGNPASVISRTNISRAVK